MKRREFLGTLIAVAAIPLAPTIAKRVIGPQFPPLNWIDLPEDITSLQPWQDSLYVFTARSMYRVDGCYPPYRFKANRLWAMNMLDDGRSLPCVTRQKYL